MPLARASSAVTRSPSSVSPQKTFPFVARRMVVESMVRCHPKGVCTIQLTWLVTRESKSSAATGRPATQLTPRCFVGRVVAI